MIPRVAWIYYKLLVYVTDRISKSSGLCMRPRVHATSTLPLGFVVTLFGNGEQEK